MSMISSLGEKMLLHHPNTDHSKAIYDLDIGDDRANQQVDISHGSLDDRNWANLELFNQEEIDIGRFIPNERYSMISMSIRGANLKYFEQLFRHVRASSALLPIPKEDLPCFGGLVFIQPRDLTYQEAKAEILTYIEKASGKRVYISELAEELQIEMDLIERILNDIRRSAGVGDYV